MVDIYYKFLRMDGNAHMGSTDPSSQYMYFKRAQVYNKLNEPDNALDDRDTALSIQKDYDNAILLKELILERITEEKDYLSSIYQ
jgi:hypothetical protein